MEGFKLDVTGLLKGMSEYEIKTTAAIELYGQTSALKLQHYMQSKRKWKDRTGDARKRLKGELERYNGKNYRIKLSHGVYYGVFLEFAHEKRFAIIKPTIDAEGPKVLKGLENVLRNIK